jgi:hypothetical protein
LSERWDAVPFGDTAARALQLAAGDLPPGGVLETGPVLLALARVDVHGYWSRIWLRTGFPAGQQLRAVRDPHGPAHGDDWKGMRVSDDLARALRVATDAAVAERMIPVPPGLLAYALLASPEAGASQMLLAQSDVAHADLLALVRHDLLGSDWTEPGPRTTGPATDSHTSWLRRAESIAAPRPADDLDLLAVLIDAGGVDERMNGPLIGRVLADLGDQARPLGVRGAGPVVQAACDEFGVVEPNAHQLVFAAADHPSAALAGIVEVAGGTAGELAAGAMIALAPEADRGVRQPREVLVWTIIDLFLTIACAFLVVRHAFETGRWYELAFAVLAFSGPPAVTAWLPGLGAIALAFLDLPAASALAAGALAGWMRTRCERTALTSRTGVRLGLAEYRAFVMRSRYTTAFRRLADTNLARFRAPRLLGRVAARQSGGAV